MPLTLPAPLLQLHRFEERIEKATQTNLRDKLGSTVQVLTSFDDDEIKMPVIGLQVTMSEAMGDNATFTANSEPPFLPRGYTFELVFQVMARRKGPLTTSELVARLRVCLLPQTTPIITLGNDLAITFLTPGATTRSVDNDEKIDLSVLTYNGQLALK